MKQKPRRLDRPEAGGYTIRMVRGGPLVPVWLTQAPDGRWLAVVGQELLSHSFSDDELTAACGLGIVRGELFSHDFLRVLAFANKIPDGEYERLMGLYDTAPDWHPCHRPEEPIDLDKLPPGMKWK